MFIKQIIIQGFKSYKEQTVMEPFSEKHNVVVGRNGSGKSNFFWAIRFVLGDAYQNMTREERQGLLHEGSGQQTISAFVEIIFDNSDNRFPTGKEEVVLRRTIGLKKDEYSLDRKSVTKSEVLNLLESAGFSRSNPYYIVPQGRITALTNSKEADRLLLLKDVAGTKVYEQRRHESVKIMTETNNKREQINELLEYIEKRLEELEEEKKELAEYQKADKERRCLEYALYFKEQNDAVAQLEELEQDRSSEQQETIERYKHLSDRLVIIQEMEQELMDDKQKLELLFLEKQQVEEDSQERIKAKAHLALAIQDMGDTVSEVTKQRAQLISEQSQLQKQIKEKQKELDKLNPQFEKILSQETSEQESLQELQSKSDSLSAKQGRFDRFNTAAERDVWLRQSIQDSKTTLATLTEQVGLLQRSKERNTAEVERLTNEISATRASNDSNKTRIVEIETLLNDRKREKDQCENEKKNLWRDEAKIASTLESVHQTTDKLTRTLMGTMDRNTSKALKSVPKIVERLQLRGYYGPLFDLFNVDESLQTAVEVVGGNSLFHVVVDTDQTASAILKVLNHEKAGRVTFMPLNRLRPKEQTYPESDRAIPLISRLEYDDRFHPAMLQVFGKAIIAPSLEEASAFAKSHGLTGVTFEGDRADRKGALTGGFVDYKHSRLGTVKLLQDSQRQEREMEVESGKLKESIRKTEQTVLGLRDQIQELEQQHRSLSSNRSNSLQEVYSKSNKLQELENTLVQQEKHLNGLESTIETVRKEIQDYEAEVGSPLRKKLDANDQRLLLSLPDQVKESQNKLSELVVNRTKLQGKKVQLEISISTNLSRRLEQVDQALDKIADANVSSGRVDEQAIELERIESELGRFQDRLEEIGDQIEETKDKMEQDGQRLEKAKAEQTEDSLAVERQQRVMDKFLTKKALLVQKKEAAVRHIRDLGVLPEEAFEKYQDFEMKNILRSLHQVNETLKKYEHVNKKAFEQYSNFTKQREQLEHRKEELNQSAQSIETLISTLDQRKNEAIEKTFEQVALFFSETWQRLVPTGEGELMMIRKEQDSLAASQSQIEVGMEQYSGIALNVSFTPGQKLRMSQLSGGQKSLVALTLIFAIQKCDPAPFYLFDEIDAALDTQYRTAVAEMIHELSENAQFITTTFRPELLVNASKFYGVTFVQKVSKIQCIPREQAQHFVENQATTA